MLAKDCCPIKSYKPSLPIDCCVFWKGFLVNTPTSMQTICVHSQTNSLKKSKSSFSLQMLCDLKNEYDG